MKRRTFMKRGLVSAAAGASCVYVGGLTARNLTATPFGSFTSNHTRVELAGLSNDKLLSRLIEIHDRRIPEILERQNRDESHRFFGGFPNRYDIYPVGRAASYIRNLVAGFVAPQSTYHRSAKVSSAIDAAIDFLLDRQHADGTIDLITTNFHSPPDTGFAVEPLAMALSCLRQYEPDTMPQVQEKMGQFLLAAGRALTKGGIHTPNHRWVVCMALARIHALFPADQYVRRIDEWLNEKIDIDPDGQYTEKSTSIYTPLVNRCLITIARLLDRPSLLEPVRRNLKLSRYFIRLNGEVVTAASRRQDQYRVAKAHRYYYSYRAMALKDESRLFSAMAQRIERTCGLESIAGQMAYFLEDRSLLSDLPPAGKLSDDWEKVFPHSGLVRIRREATDITILESSDRVLTYHHGSAVLQGLRLASAFFGKGQFQADSLTRENGNYVLKQSLTGPYWQPLPIEHLPSDGDWNKMPRHLRPTSEVQNLHSRITIRESDGQLTVNMQVTGTDHVPVAVELGFRPGGEFTGVTALKDIPNAWLLTGQMATYRSGGDVIQFGPGRADHRWTQLRGAQGKIEGNSVYVTGYTPFEYELKLIGKS